MVSENVIVSNADKQVCSRLVCPKIFMEHIWPIFDKKKKKIHIPMKKVQLSFEMDERKTFQDIFIDTL